MALDEVTIHFDVHQLLGANFSDLRRIKGRIETNVPSRTLMDNSTGETRVGDQPVTINPDGTGSWTTWAPEVGVSNPASWQETLVLDYPLYGANDRDVRPFGPYTLSVADDGKNITDLEEEQGIPPEAIARVQAILDQAEALVGVDDTDSAQAYNIEYGPLTSAAVAALVSSLIAADVPPMLAEALVDANPAIAAAAAALAQSDVGLVHRGEAMLPRLEDIEDPPGTVVYADPEGRTRLAYQPDGYSLFPLLRAVKADLGGMTVEYDPRWSGYTMAFADPLDRVFYATPADGSAFSGVVGTGADDPSTWPMIRLPFAGQSNASTPDPLPPEVHLLPEDPRIFRLSNDGLSIQQGSGYATSNGYNYAMAELAKMLCAYLPPRTSILLENNTYGGSGATTTSIDPAPTGYHLPAGEGTPTANPGSPGGTWDRTLTSDPFNRAIAFRNRLLAAEALAPAGSYIGFVFWCQGEADRNYMNGSGQPSYLTFWTDLWDWLRSETGEELPTVIGSMAPEAINVNAASILMDKVHRDIPRTVERTAYVRGPRDMVEFLTPTVHYSSHAQKVRAAGILAAADRARRNVTTIEPSQPLNATIKRRADGQVTISWDASPGRSTKYLLKYKVGSGSYVDVDMSASPVLEPLAQSYVIPSTVAATDVVYVQLAGVNEVGTSAYTMEVSA